jgi:hypothetical protein
MLMASGGTRLALRAVLEPGTPRCGWCRREQRRGQETWTDLGPYRETIRFAPAHRLLRGHQKWEPTTPCRFPFLMSLSRF